MLQIGKCVGPKGDDEEMILLELKWNGRVGKIYAAKFSIDISEISFCLTE